MVSENSTQKSSSVVHALCIACGKKRPSWRGPLQLELEDAIADLKKSSEEIAEELRQHFQKFCTCEPHEMSPSVSGVKRDAKLFSRRVKVARGR